MSHFALFDYESNGWLEIQNALSNVKLNNLDDVKQFISSLAHFRSDTDFATLDCLNLEANKVVDIFSRISRFALQMPVLFPESKIPCLQQNQPKIEFSRAQVLCLLCHMVLCTLKPSSFNAYWVTFENWLTDGRCCALAYIQVLFEYLDQALAERDYDPFMQERVVFKRSSKSLEDVMSALEQNPPNCKVTVFNEGSIGDLPSAELDFANQDIGFGITGTQEEMLFGSSPELCIAMLFCKTMQDDEAICIEGAIKMATFNGYGTNVTVASDIRNERKDRVVIAIDAMEIGWEDGLVTQLQPKSLKREIVKAYAGFSFVENTSISTGHWGCGAFGGHKHVKAIIQLLAASLSFNELFYYSFGDEAFTKDFTEFLVFVASNGISAQQLWSAIQTIHLNEHLEELENSFVHLMTMLSRNFIK